MLCVVPPSQYLSMAKCCARAVDHLFRNLTRSGPEPLSTQLPVCCSAVRRSRLDLLSKVQLTNLFHHNIESFGPSHFTSRCCFARTARRLKDMIESGVQPDMVTYNTVINALGRCGRVVEATEHLHAMKEQGLSPDVVTFGTLIHACAQSARREPALALFSELVSASSPVTAHDASRSGCLSPLSYACVFFVNLRLFVCHYILWLHLVRSCCRVDASMGWCFDVHCCTPFFLLQVALAIVSSVAACSARLCSRESQVCFLIASDAGLRR